MMSRVAAVLLVLFGLLASAPAVYAAPPSSAVTPASAGPYEPAQTAPVPVDAETPTRLGNHAAADVITLIIVGAVIYIALFPGMYYRRTSRVA